MDKIQSILAFTRVVQNGSFSAVARELNTSQATISKRISALEKSLNLILLTRNSHGQKLTEAGTVYYEKCLAVLEALEDAETAVRTQTNTPRGQLRITMPVDFSLMIIEPVIKSFLNIYPEIKVDILLDNKIIDFVTSGIDVAIRITKPQDSTLVAKKICVSHGIAVASPDYLHSHGTPKNTQELTMHNCIAYSGSPELSPFNSNMQCSNGLAMMEAAIHGIGIAILPQWLVYQNIQDKKLTRILPDFSTEHLPVNLLYAQRKHLPLKTKVFIEHLRQNISNHPAFTSC